MATQGERRALMFLAAVALLGAGTRALRARRVAVSTDGLNRQIGAIDSVGGLAARRVGRSSSKSSATPAASQPVDLDIASADEIERLPGIGPALARRIVADRNAHGPFGCLAALDRVKGVGPTLLGRLDSLTAFSAGGQTPCEPAGRRPR